MASSPITSWEIDGEIVETVPDFILGGSKITAGGDCSHEIKRCLLLGRKVMTNLDSIFKSRDITWLTKVLPSLMRMTWWSKSKKNKTEWQCVSFPMSCLALEFKFCKTIFLKPIFLWAFPVALPHLKSSRAYGGCFSCLICSHTWTHSFNPQTFILWPTCAWQQEMRRGPSVNISRC